MSYQISFETSYPRDEGIRVIAECCIDSEGLIDTICSADVETDTKYTCYVEDGIPEWLRKRIENYVNAHWASIKREAEQEAADTAAEWKMEMDREERNQK